MPTFCARVAVCAVAVAACTRVASAQQDVVRDALIGFHAKLAGDKGDEGPAILAELDRMSSALKAWDRSARAAGSVRRTAPAIREEDPVAAYTERRTPALLTMLDRRFQSVPAGRHLELFPETVLVPDRAAVTPVFSPALYVQGFAHALAGRYEDAVASFRSAAARDPLVVGGPSEPHRIQAIRAIDAGNDAKAVAEFEIAVSIAPNDERASVALGRALEHAGQADRAEQVLLATIRKLPQSADAHSALADLYEARGRGRDALREVEAAAALPVLAGKAALYFRLADLEHRHLEYTRVIDPLVKRVRLIPNDGRAHTDLGLAYIRVGRTDDALIELVMASLLGPEDAEALAAIGQIHFDAGNYVAAETILRRAVIRTPALAQPHYLLGQTFARLGLARESEAELAEFDRLRAAANEETRRAFEKGQRAR